MSSNPAHETRGIVECSDLRFGWRRDGPTTVSIDTLRIDRGERLLLRGPSGCGKSTLLGLIAGINVAQRGSVRVLGQDLGALASGARDRFRADHIGVIFQSFNLIPYLSVHENVCLPCAFSAARRDRCAEQGTTPAAAASALLATLDLGGVDLARQPANALSIGQQQRVAAARALIGAPELIIADEPTSSLDADRRTRFLDLLFRECDRAGTTLIFVTHDVALAPAFDRTIEFDSINAARANVASEAFA
jgi:putative ABC transport system ATP-binding protein